MPGDYDNNGEVDLEDSAHLLGCMTRPGNGPTTADCEVFCFDADNDVDLADFADFALVFTGG